MSYPCARYKREINSSLLSLCTTFVAVPVKLVYVIFQKLGFEYGGVRGSSAGVEMLRAKALVASIRAKRGWRMLFLRRLSRSALEFDKCSWLVWGQWVKRASSELAGLTGEQTGEGCRGLGFV
jgi:hypothetical protein